MLTIRFKRFDWSLAIGYFVSTNMTSLLWIFKEEKCNTSNVILCPPELANFWYKLVMLVKIPKQNDIVKENVEDVYEFHFGSLFYSRFSFTWHLSRVCEKWTARIVSNSLFLREVICCYKTLWEFSVTKPICHKDVFVNSFCYPTFRLTNSLVVELFLWLII